MASSRIDLIEIDPIDYLRATRAVELYLNDARHESRPILARLEAIRHILTFTEPCKEMFTEVRAEVIAKRE